MATFQITFCEAKTVNRYIAMPIEADDEDTAAQRAIEAYENGELDTALEETEPDTSSCETAVAVERDGATVWVL